MIPSVIANQIRRGLENFLLTTYQPESPFFNRLFEEFFECPDALFRGPFFSLKLPFRPGNGLEKTLYKELPMEFSPYRHQEKAFQRLTEKKQSTLIATGTGSGKTECFMYPILHHCWEHRGEPGIKAILIYPMNALATDQAKRFAKEIYDNSELHNQVDVGLFIGSGKKHEGFKTMGKENVITQRETIQENPPDILMTNYRMLDYLLLRPKDFKLWRYNQPETLKYIVVDELHTFDGAQGTDLACLLRRLAVRLKSPTDYLCYVGTSATLGNNEGKEKMREFAQELFGTTFDSNAIISEDVLDSTQFFGRTLIQSFSIPTEKDLDQLKFENSIGENDYLAKQVKLWFEDKFSLPKNESEFTEAVQLELGEKLRQHIFFQNLIRLLDNTPVVENKKLSKLLDSIIPDFSSKKTEFQTAFIDSIYALISFARQKIKKSNGKSVCAPFLQVRVQLWMREMRRMVTTVCDHPQLRFASDSDSDDTHGIKRLPLVVCRDCGRAGYLSSTGVDETGDKLSCDLNKLYHDFFSHSRFVTYIFPEDQNEPGSVTPAKTRLCGHCLRLFSDTNIKDGMCPNCKEQGTLIQVQVPDVTVKSDSDKSVHVYNNCPYCQGRNSLTLLGAQSATLASIVISQLFASRFNGDQKLLTFADSVQDASHHASFFNARTYRFNLRAAIQQVVQDQLKKNGEGASVLTLEALTQKFIPFWLEQLGNSKPAFIAQFIPTDLQGCDEYEDMITIDGNPVAPKFYQQVCDRIRWEIISEYGYRACVGRTLEKTGCSVVYLAPNKLKAWVDATWLRLSEEIGCLRDASKIQLERYLVAMIYLIRIKGGIYFDCFNEYMRNGDSYKLKLQNPYMQNFGPWRDPLFPCCGSHSHRQGVPMLPAKSKLSVYQKLLNRCFNTLASLYSESIFKILLEAGCELDILHKESTGASVYALNPAMLEVSNQVVFFTCSDSGNLVSVASAEQELWQGMPSLQHLDRENVHMELQSQDAPDYYASLYSQGKVHRVIAREHTSLLERSKREDLEIKFIEGTDIAAPNLLSCTPTLEMGINIGDLASVILSSMPPTQANYIQRIGRSGRKYGNAFNFVVATQSHHDLHFFAEPLEMLAGSVTPPGIFLNAPAVLERQLAAYCFDRWVEVTRGDSGVPDKLGATLRNVARQDTREFPYPFLNFIEKNGEKLFAGFCRIFNDALTDESRTHLKTFLLGADGDESGLDPKILDRLRATLTKKTRTYPTPKRGFKKIKYSQS